jgi:hypothetical protein
MAALPSYRTCSRRHSHTQRMCMYASSDCVQPPLVLYYLDKPIAWMKKAEKVYNVPVSPFIFIPTRQQKHYYMKNLQKSTDIQNIPLVRSHKLIGWVCFLYVMYAYYATYISKCTYKHVLPEVEKSKI